MRATVYRSIDTANTFLGLAFPSEVLVVLATFWATAVTLPPGTGLLITIASYVVLRVMTMGRPPLHLQHLALFHARRGLNAGRFSPGARAASHTRFPFAPRRFRDVVARGIKPSGPS